MCVIILVRNTTPRQVRCRRIWVRICRMGHWAFHWAEDIPETPTAASSPPSYNSASPPSYFSRDPPDDRAETNETVIENTEEDSREYPLLSEG